MSTFDFTLPGATLEAVELALEGFVAGRRIKYLPIGVVDVVLTHQAHPNGGYVGLNGEPIHPEDGRRYEVLPVLAEPDEARLPDKSGCGIYATAGKDGVRVEIFFLRRGSRQIAPVMRKIPPNFASLFSDELATYLRSAFPERGKTIANDKRKRGPSPDVLEDCVKAVELWLDKGVALNTAAQRCGRDDETVLRWLPNVLEARPEKRDEWMTKIRALGKEKYLSND